VEEEPAKEEEPEVMDFDSVKKADLPPAQDEGEDEPTHHTRKVRKKSKDKDIGDAKKRQKKKPKSRKVEYVILSY